MHSSHTSPSLATRFARNTFVLRSETPLAEDQMRQAAPSIFASGKHASRSEHTSFNARPEWTGSRHGSPLRLRIAQREASVPNQFEI